MEKNVLKCFIASPSDVSAERAACDEVVNSINIALGDALGVQLDTVRWEKDSHAAVGADGQDVINNQLHPEDADFFVGIFWGRFGAPTPRAESGSVEEFERAYARWQTEKSNKIMFFFKNKPVSTDKIDGVQIDKVNAFKSKVSSCGCLYKEFSELDEFKTKLREALEREIVGLQKKGCGERNRKDVQKMLDDDLKNALSLYTDQDVVWLDRKICDPNGLAQTLAESYDKSRDVIEILDESSSCVIKAPPQYGLTCLGYYLRAEAWKRGKTWIYIDASSVRIRKLEEIVAGECEKVCSKAIDGVILDAWSPDMANAQKIFERVGELFPTAQLIVLEPSLDRVRLLKTAPIKINRKMKMYQLLPLAKYDLRKAVVACGKKFADDADSMLNKIVLNMDNLNIHRTPMNCWTLLKVAERDHDIGPVNRTEMLQNVLIVLFNLNDIPSYTIKPDARDCERMLGEFCGKLIKEGRTDFTEDEFRGFATQYIGQKLIEIDVGTLWRILTENKILTRIAGSVYRFGATFWLFFFAAKHMDVNEEFKKYILSEKRYAQFPEIIEFYTGLGRDKVDILTLLDADLLTTKEVLSSKLGLPKDFNPLQELTWTSSSDDAKQMHEIISDAVNRSRVPDEIKDHYADSHYNYNRPFDQSIHNYVEGASFYLFIQQLRALSRALRNSEYVSPEIKLQVLQHVIAGWSEICRVLFFMARTLVKQGRAFFEGFGFYLDKEFRSDEPTDAEVFVRILEACPHNVLWLVKDDLSSQKQAPLLYKWAEGWDDKVSNKISLHLFMLYLVYERPHGWENKIKFYLTDLKKDSFYLCNIKTALEFQMHYGYPSVEDERRMIELTKECVAQHRQLPTGLIAQPASSKKTEVQEGIGEDERSGENGTMS